MNKPKKPNPALDFSVSEADFDQLTQPFDPDKFAEDQILISGGHEEPRIPIILAHGIMRPDYLVDSFFRTFSSSWLDFGFIRDRVHYFRGIATHLNKHGFNVFHSNVSFAADLATRSRDLSQEVQRILEKSGHDQAHIIAHSMGGLDARAMITREGMAPHVASLTTIGTPHFGTPLAGIAMENGADLLFRMMKMLVNLDGFRSLTQKACAEFNAEQLNAEIANDVLYQAYFSHKPVEEVFLPMQLSARTISEMAGENDGLVPLSSQQWLPELRGRGQKSKRIIQQAFPFPADHLDQVGWCRINASSMHRIFHFRAQRDRSKDELAVKNLYLKIASDVHQLVEG